MNQPKKQFKNLDGISKPKQQIADLKQSQTIDEQVIKPAPASDKKQNKWRPQDLGIFFNSNIFTPIRKHPIWSVSYLFLASALAITLFVIFQPAQALEPIKEIPENYTEPLVVSLGEDVLSLQPVKGRAVTVKQEGDRYIYEEAYKYTDVVQTNYPYKIKEELVFSQPGHPLVFEYQLGNLDNFIIEQDADGNIIFHNREQYLNNGGPSPLSRVFTIPTPFVEDRTKFRSFSAVDTILDENTGLMKISISNEWLSNVQYPVILDPTIEINVLNVHSHPGQGEDWTVDFTTQGKADLKIIPNDQATIDDDIFTSLSCDGEERIPQILTGDIIYYPDWQCSGVAQVVHFTAKAGNHILKFEFAGVDSYAEDYAYNAAGIAYDNSDGIRDTGITATVSNFAVGAGNNRALFAITNVRQGSGVDVSSVVFNGSESFQEVTSVSDNDVIVQIWYLVNPTQTTADVVATATSDPYAQILAVLSLNGVHQSDPMPTSATGTNADWTNYGVDIITQYENSWLFGGVGPRNTNLSVTADYTSVYESDTLPSLFTERRALTTTGTYSLTWTGTGAADTGVIVGEIREAVAASPTITDILDDPDPVPQGNSISFDVDWADGDSEAIKAKLCKSNGLSAQNCTGGYWASSSAFTFDDPETLFYQTTEDDYPEIEWYGYVCDTSGSCSSATSGTTTLGLPTPAGTGIKLRSGTWKINYDDISNFLFVGLLVPFGFGLKRRKKE